MANARCEPTPHLSRSGMMTSFVFGNLISSTPNQVCTLDYCWAFDPLNLSRNHCWSVFSEGWLFFEGAPSYPSDDGSPALTSCESHGTVKRFKFYHFLFKMGETGKGYFQVQLMMLLVMGSLGHLSWEGNHSIWRKENLEKEEIVYQAKGGVPASQKIGKLTSVQQLIVLGSAL